MSADVRAQRRPSILLLTPLGIHLLVAGSDILPRENYSVSGRLGRNTLAWNNGIGLRSLCWFEGLQ